MADWSEFERALSEYLSLTQEMIEQLQIMLSLQINPLDPLAMASRMERQETLHAFQTQQSSLLSAASIIATAKQAVAQDKSAEEYHKARLSSDAMAKNYSGLMRAIDRARDSMRDGASLESIIAMLSPLVSTIQEIGTFTILLGRESKDSVVQEQAGKIEEGLAEIAKQHKAALKRQLLLQQRNLGQKQEELATYGTPGAAPLKLQNDVIQIEMILEQLREQLEKLG